MTSDPSTHLFWITSRAAGTTAMFLASATVGFGRVMSGRTADGFGRHSSASRPPLARSGA